MKLLSVNVSLPREIHHNRKTVTTGIFKQPLDGRVALRQMNLDGDGQADLVAHGGIYKAAYVYSIENYDHWKKELRQDDFTMGQFGENFTVDGMLDENVNIGDVFRVGEALVEVTQPRPPCFKLGIRMGMSGFPKLFLASCRVGFYVRVLEEGQVGAGDAIERIETNPEQMSVRKICHLLHFDHKNMEASQQALRIKALSPGWRESFQGRLTKAGYTIKHSDQPQ